MQFQPSPTLRSRTYIGLILAQFLAAFNDQAIHIVAIFYAGDMLVRFVGLRLGHVAVDDKMVISIVTACFISPFLFFSTLAGMLADKFSKRTTLVFWKLAEVGMMALALAGFLLPHFAGTLASAETLALWSAILVVSVVFLMGTHSAFFVPAKYGVMPEILHPVVLSRGNGFLEGTSFVAQIIGTTVGGVLYTQLQSRIEFRAGGNLLNPGKEWLIGLLLLVLAVVGATASFCIRRMPAAAPQQRLTWKLWQPLSANLRVLLRSRPLALAVLGIAFFTFITLFARQTLLYHGETGKELKAARHLAAGGRFADAENHVGPADRRKAISEDQEAERKVALLIALIGLGIGIGSPLAGTLSGNKVELGLVPIGAVFIILMTALMAFVIQWEWATVACLISVGIAAGFYIVPLYTLLQHRAPKDSKGNLVATSNFVNVAGGLLAVATFYLVTIGLEGALGLALDRKAVAANPALAGQYVAELEQRTQVPRMLFLVLSFLTGAMLLLLCRKLPDFLVRSLLWLRSHGRYRLKVVGMQNLPSDGPVILATNCDRFETCMQVVTATDRFTRFVLLEADPNERPPWLLRYLARRTGLVALASNGARREEWQKASVKAEKALLQGHLVGITADGAGPRPEMMTLLRNLRGTSAAPVIPIYCGALPEPSHQGRALALRRVQVVIGHPLAADATPEAIRQAIHALGEWMREMDQAGQPAITAMIPGALGALPRVTAPPPPAHP
jgi:acyl-[acyl-carrier-protein]-phospholipid O-acyltransferase/long-chain-fatty-acid--[acyl-carrier-protein] ligase